MSLPVVELSGTPYEQGLQHGRALSGEIAHNLAVYLERFEREVGLVRDELHARALRYLDALRGHSEDYVQGIRGIADGAGIAFDEIAVLNLRYELLYYQFGQKALAQAEAEPSSDADDSARADGCTSFALPPASTQLGHLLMGQNWDWIPQVAGALIRSEDPDGRRILGFTEAGILGAKIGLNDAGVGLAINGMTTTEDDWTRFARPFHLRCYEILRAPDFEAAVKVIAGEPRSCTTNFLVAGTPDHIADLEAAPDIVNTLSCEDGRLVHANHFRDPDACGVVEPPSPTRHHSRHREARLGELLAGGGPFSTDEVIERLRDHDGRPNSICRHEDPERPEEERVITVSSVVMDLDAGRLWASDGPPCESDYQELSL